MRLATFHMPYARPMAFHLWGFRMRMKMKGSLKLIWVNTREWEEGLGMVVRITIVKMKLRR